MWQTRHILEQLSKITQMDHNLIRNYCYRCFHRRHTVNWVQTPWQCSNILSPNLSVELTAIVAIPRGFVASSLDCFLVIKIFLWLRCFWHIRLNYTGVAKCIFHPPISGGVFLLFDICEQKPFSSARG